MAKFAKTGGLGVTILALALLVSSCVMTGPNEPLPVTPPAAFSGSGEAVFPDRWWEAFEDSALNRWVEQALLDSFTVASARDRLQQAQAAARKRGATKWPSVDGRSGAERSVLRSSQSGREYTNDFSLGVSAGYEVDLWGGIQAERDAATLNAQATAVEVKTARLTVAAAVARTWFSILDARMRLKMLDEQIETNEKYLKVIERQFRSGQAAITDVLQQRQILEARRGRQQLILATIKTDENELAVWTGRVPGTLNVSAAGELPELPPLPKTGVPLEALRQRPDVKAAELRLASASRDVVVALADRFPQLRLGVTAQTAVDDIRDVFDNWLASVAADLTAPLFDAGLRRAEIERVQAVYSEQLNDYTQTILEAAREVEDALEIERRQAAYTASLERQLGLADKALQQTLERYTKGAMTFTRYLTALIDYQTLQLEWVQARRDTVYARIDLYRALAGDIEEDSSDTADTLNGADEPEGR